MLAATMAGMKKYQELFDRKRTLQNILDGSVKIKETLRCVCLPLHESFLYGGEFFFLASEKINEGMLPETAVTECAKQIPCLRVEERNIFERFAHGLDARDCQGQISNLEVFIKDLENALSVATAELSSKGTLYVKGSILTAAAIVLLLI